MRGRIESGQLCTVAPILNQVLKPGDVVLCRVKGRDYLHLIRAQSGNRFQIGNNRGGINGWITAQSIYGKCTQVAP